MKERLASETIWSNGHVIIPMCDVQHIENRDRKEWDSLPVTQSSRRNVVKKGIIVVMKSTRFDSGGDWDNGIWLWDDAATSFVADYCTFRSEIDPVRQGPGYTEGHAEFAARGVCEVCDLLKELYESAGGVPERAYWLMTELFVRLHS